MKKPLLFISALVVLSFNALAQTAVPNGSFETWTNNGSYTDPIDWTSANDVYYIFGISPITQVSPGHSGSYAAQMQTAKFTFITATDSVGGFMQTSNTYGNSTYIPLTEQAPSLIGFYKFAQGSAAVKDSANIQVYVYDNGGNTLGAGSIYIKDPAASFMQFTVPITYIAGVPDSATILITGSVAGVSNTTLIIDDLSFTAAVTGVQAASNPSGIVVYPNPAADAISIKNLPASAAQITITDYTGRTIKTIPASSSLINIALDGTTAGLYFYSVTDNSGSVIYSDKFAVTK